MLINYNEYWFAVNGSLMVSTLPSTNPNKPCPIFNAPAFSYDPANYRYYAQGTLDPPMVLHISSGIIDVVEGFTLQGPLYNKTHVYDESDHLALEFEGYSGGRSLGEPTTSYCYFWYNVTRGCVLDLCS